MHNCTTPHNLTKNIVLRNLNGLGSYLKPNTKLYRSCLVKTTTSDCLQLGMLIPGYLMPTAMHDMLLFIIYWLFCSIINSPFNRCYRLIDTRLTHSIPHYPDFLMLLILESTATGLNVQFQSTCPFSYTAWLASYYPTDS